MKQTEVVTCQFCDERALFWYQDYIEDPFDTEETVYFALIEICYKHLIELERKR